MILHRLTAEYGCMGPFYLSCSVVLVVGMVFIPGW